MKKILFTIDNKVSELGVRIFTAQIFNIQNTKTNNGFEDYLKSELDTVKRYWQNRLLKEDKILKGFHNLHSKIGRSRRDYQASPEFLLGLFLRTGRFPRINTLVDIYNLISLKTRLALGAHDISKIQGNVTLRLTNGSETFIPLGKTEPLHIPAGEYAYIDDGNNIICRMEVLQVEPTKITLGTRDVFLIIQGNLNTETPYINHAVNEVVRLITKFCGGEIIKMT